MATSRTGHRDQYLLAAAALHVLLAGIFVRRFDERVGRPQFAARVFA